MTNADLGTDHDPVQWAEAGGNIQSLTFYFTALNRIAALPVIKELTAWHIMERDETGQASLIQYKQVKVHDYGCGEGDGTALLQVMFPLSDIVGIDASQAARDVASKRWPTLEFRLGDIQDPQEDVHIIYTSHTIEHFKDPGAIIDKLRAKCQILIAVFPPIKPGKDGGHKDAALTEEWLPKVLMEHDGLKMSFMTCRKASPATEALPEGNILLLVQGELYGQMIA